MSKLNTNPDEDKYVLDSDDQGDNQQEGEEEGGHGGDEGRDDDEYEGQEEDGAESSEEEDYLDVEQEEVGFQQVNEQLPTTSKHPDNENTQTQEDSQNQTQDELLKSIIHGTKQKPQKKRNRKNQITHQEIILAIRSLGAQLDRIENHMRELDRKVNELTQCNPTFLTQGKSGPLFKASQRTNNTVVMT